MKIERINENEKKHEFASKLKSDEIMFPLCSSLFRYKWCINVGFYGCKKDGIAKL